MATRAEWLAECKIKREARERRIAAWKANRRHEREHAEAAIVQAILDMIDNGAGRPIQDVELRSLGHAYLRIAKRETAAGRLLCCDSGYSRLNMNALSST